MPIFGSSNAHSIEVDESAWPLLIIRYKGLSPLQDYADMLAERSRQLGRQERHMVLHDMREASSMATRGHRHIQLEWMRKEEGRIRQWLVGTASLTDSVALRLLMSAVQHLRPLPVPHATFSRLPAALLWIEAQMRQSGLEAGAHVVRSRFELGGGPHPG